MRCSVRSKGVILLNVLLIHAALGNPVVRRDVQYLLDGDSAFSAVADPQFSLTNADVFGGEAHENGSRDKRTILKLKGLALTAAAKAVGTGVKAVGAGVATVAAAGAKTVGTAALKVATTVGLKVAKAAITIGIAKLLLSLVFGTRLLGGGGSGKGLLGSSNLGSLSSSSGSSSSSSGSNGGGDSASPSYDGYDGSTEGAAGDSGIGEELPEIDPQKISLQIPSEIISGGFNVVNRAAPVFGEVIQRTAERLVDVGASLKPLFASSFGFGSNSNSKRETYKYPSDGQPSFDSEQTNEASSETQITAEPSSQFKRSYDPTDVPVADDETVLETDSNNAETTSSNEENDLKMTEKKLLSALLARKVIDKLLEERLKEEQTEKSIEQTTTPQPPSETPPQDIKTIILESRVDQSRNPLTPTTLSSIEITTLT